MSGQYQSNLGRSKGAWSRRRFVRCAGWAVGLAGTAGSSSSRSLTLAGQSPEVAVPQLAGVLPQPRRGGGGGLLDALRTRSTQRDFQELPLSRQLLSDLLWAAFGVNRPETGQRTAPSAMDNREIDILVALREGVFRFDAENHRLASLLERDVRPLTGGQSYVSVAPVTLVYVADGLRQGRVPPDERAFYAAADTGFISQSVYLFCASEGLATVVHVVPDRGGLAATLGLRPEQSIVLAQCVGYPAGGDKTRG